MVHECTGGGEHQHQYALSGNGDVDHRATPIADARLSLIRYPACRAADKVATCGVLSRALAHQRVLYSKHMAWWTAPLVAGVLARNLIRGRTNFIRSIMNYSKVYNVEKMLADHAQPVHYELPLPPRSATDGRDAKSSQLYIHAPRGR